MNFGLSTQLFFPHRLTTAHLDALADSGARTIELFAARHHVDYTDRQQLRELAQWFRANDVAATLHAPLTAQPAFSRHAAPDLDLISTSKPQRIAAMEETRRALDIAEHIPATFCTLHLGLTGPQDDATWSDYTLDYSLTAVEHLKAFAAPLGVKLLLENIRNEVATPAHLLEILRIGHFDSCGICLDVAHAHLDPAGIPAAFELLRPRILALHLSDNDGRSDQHLWPASGTERPAAALTGTIDWPHVYALAESLPGTPPLILEIDDRQADTPATAERLAREVFAHATRLVEISRSSEG